MRTKKEVTRAKGHETISCPICKDPLRKEMERAYLNWLSPAVIATAFNLTFPFAQAHVASHMEVTGLRDKRKVNSWIALEKIIETGAQRAITAGEIIHAVETMAKLNEKGKWAQTEDENSGELTVNVIEYKNGGNK